MCRPRSRPGVHAQAAPGITERRVIFPPYPDLAAAVAGFGHNLFVLDPDGPLRHTVPFVRSRGVSLPSLGLAGALRAAGIPPEAVRLDARGLRLGDRVMPLDWREVRSAEGVTAYQWGLVNFRGPALLADLESRPYPRYAFYDLLYSEEQIASGADAEDRPVGLPRQDRVRRRDRRRASSTSSRRRSPAAGCPASRCTPRSPTTCCRTGS